MEFFAGSKAEVLIDDKHYVNVGVQSMTVMSILVAYYGSEKNVKKRTAACDLFNIVLKDAYTRRFHSILDGSAERLRVGLGIRIEDAHILCIRSRRSSRCSMRGGRVRRASSRPALAAIASSRWCSAPLPLARARW